MMPGRSLPLYMTLPLLAGALANRGMPDFGKWIKPEEADSIRAYLAAQGGKLYAAERKAK